ncbi:unnamed protein product [Urochloa decumbens]|uniref:Uncharacterized protein n=1 Tax=Urochloa decumbens TaxID=240449 RepID=A0ABC8ZX90_9POAL
MSARSLSPARSPAMDTAESRLGRGRNLPARRRCCDCCAAGEGRAVAASARRAHSPPSTAPIRTSALPIRRLALAPSRLVVGLELPGDGGEVGLWPWPPGGALRSLWRLQRKEPGWFVGEHMQVRRLRAAPPAGDETLTELPAGDRAPALASLIRVGEAEP